MNKKNFIEAFAWLILFAALYPLTACVKGYQGWGGDYAGYLLEMKAIAEGSSLTTTDYLYNPAYIELAPPAYPVGFPLLLLPVYKIWGFDIQVFIKYMGFLWWGLGVMLFVLLKRYFSVWASLVATIFWLFHPLFFNMKNDVLSDVPFVFFVLLTFYVYDRSSGHFTLKNAIAVGILAGFAWLQRSVGFVLVGVLAVHFLTEICFFDLDNKQKRIWQRLDAANLKYVGVVLLSAIGLPWVLHNVLFPLPVTGAYADQLDLAGWQGILNRNAVLYMGELFKFFQLRGEGLSFIGRTSNDAAVALGGILAFAAMVWGLFAVKTRFERLLLYWMLAYLFVVLIWPSHQGLRFMLPLLAVGVYFILKSLSAFDSGTRLGGFLKWAIIPLLLYGEYWRLDNWMAYKFPEMDAGTPEWRGNQEAFKFIRDSMPKDAIYASHHPLIFALYAKRKAMRWAKFGEVPEIDQQLKDFKVDYILLENWLVDNEFATKRYLDARINQLDTVWYNERNVLYKLNLGNDK